MLKKEVASLTRYAPCAELPATRAAADQVLSLPIYPSLTPIELERIVHGVNALAQAGA